MLRPDLYFPLTRVYCRHLARDLAVAAPFQPDPGISSVSLAANRLSQWGGRCASVPRARSGRPYCSVTRWATKQRLRRNSRVRSGEWSGEKSRARSRAYSRACSVAATGRVVGRVPSRVLLPVSLPVTDRAAPPLAPKSPYVRSGPATSPLIHENRSAGGFCPPVLHNQSRFRPFPPAS